MATSLTPVRVPSNTWVDIYAATGIAVGTQIIVQNIGSSEAILSESATEPTSTVGYNAIPPRIFLTNAVGSLGAWAFSESGTTLQVEGV